MPVGYGEWRAGRRLRSADAGVEQKVAASGAWTADDTYTVKVCLHETPYCTTLGLRFAGDAVVLDQETNVAFGPTKRPQLVGRPSRRRSLPGRRARRFEIRRGAEAAMTTRGARS